MADELQDTGRTRSNPGAGHSERPLGAGGKPHVLGSGKRDGDAGGTRGAGNKIRGNGDRDK